MEAEYGMQGRLRPIQLTPFECQTCYGGTVSGRHNLDLQDMRRVVDPCHWLDPEDHLPHVGPITTLGYMRLCGLVRATTYVQTHQAMQCRGSLGGWRLMNFEWHGAKHFV